MSVDGGRYCPRAARSLSAMDSPMIECDGGWVVEGRNSARQASRKPVSSSESAITTKGEGRTTDAADKQ